MTIFQAGFRLISDKSSRTLFERAEKKLPASYISGPRVEERRTLVALYIARKALA
jgi:hypothetical protein